MGGAWPAVPRVIDATPARRRRAWGKVAHADRFKSQRRDLLRAAAKLASRFGYQATHVSDIVAEAGLSKTTFYDHFKSKEDCFVELHRRVSAAMLREGIAAAERSAKLGPYETVLAVLRAVTGYVAQNPRLADVLREEVSASHPAIAEERAENQRRIVELFVTVARRLETPLPDDELRLSSTILVQGVIAVLPQLRKKQTRFDENLSSIARLACRGMGFEGR
jgi:AcrR family transcriptional regulator